MSETDPQAHPATSGARKGEYIVPDKAVAFCRSCSAPIIWGETTSDKPAPVPLSVATIRTDEHGRRWALTHFTDCPNAGQHRKTRKETSDMNQLPPNAPYNLNERASAEVCELLTHLEQLALYAEAHNSCKLTIARDLFQTVMGQRVLRRFSNATGLTLTIIPPEEGRG